MTVNYVELANAGVGAERLAETFLNEHYNGAEPTYPVNPFQMLKDYGIVFSFRPFDKYEGVYLPAENESDVPVVGINLYRPITRQRFTAAHELCHHLKDAGSNIVCPIGSRSAIERYADKFASCLLMPKTAMARQIQLRGKNGRISLDDVLQIAAYFGVSFSACLNRVAFDFHALKGSPTASEIQKLKRSFKPDKKRKALGMTDAFLYRQLLDSAADYIMVEMDSRKRQRFEATYIYHDSRMEGINVDQETAAAIVVDLRIKGASSIYCTENNPAIIEVAGLKEAYDFAFDLASASNPISAYDVKTFNEKLYSLSPHPEFGGRFRESNTLVLGARFETVDYKDIPAEFLAMRKDLDALLAEAPRLSAAEYVEAVVRFHHRLTVLHPFRDGNGRSSRGLANILFVKRGLPPVLFLEKEKRKYKGALALADRTGCCDELFCMFCKQMLASYADLSDAAL